MSTLKPGDIVEVATPNGLAYLQVTHDHPSYPPAVRGLPGLHANRVADLAALAREPDTFVSLIPLESALRAIGVRFEVVGHAAVTASYPTFRMPVRDKAGKVMYWWHWDGRGLSIGSEAASDALALPIREVIGGDELMRLLSESSVTKAGHQ